MKNKTTDVSEKGPERTYKHEQVCWLQSNRNTKNQTKWGKKKKAPDGNLVKKKRISLTLKVDMASRTLSYKEQCTFIDQEFLKTIQ